MRNGNETCKFFSMSTEKFHTPDMFTFLSQTCGLEILLSRVNLGLAKNGSDKATACERLELNPQWMKFLESLRSKGFFQNELEGSKLYQQLLSSAKEYFVSQIQDKKEELMM